MDDDSLDIVGVNTAGLKIAQPVAFQPDIFVGQIVSAFKIKPVGGVLQQVVFPGIILFQDRVSGINQDVPVAGVVGD
ncbi:MAG: hypothetical protein IPN74_12845 [Haliscomenobacter sp.]|nr:hypothetical protein [Haliscomenobacter sp.]